MNDVYNNIDDYDQLRKIKILIVFDDMIADIMTSKKFPAIIKELFIKCRKFNISLVFIPLSYFSVPKEARSNSTHYLIMKIHTQKKSYQILLLIIQQTLIIKSLFRFIGSVQVNHILLCLLILHYLLIIC